MLPKMMKAAVYCGIDHIEIQEVPLPEVDDESALVKVHACAVCGSDLRTFHHGNKRVKPGTIMGHEISGEIVAVGKNVTSLKVGDRVALGGDVPCGQCYFCKKGIGNNCQDNFALGHQFPGGFAEYLLLNRMTIAYGPVTKLPDHVCYEDGALAEPLACVLNGLDLSPVHLNDTVVVIGAGPIGLMIAQVAKEMGASKVIVVNRSRHRLEIAKKLGVGDVYVCAGEEDAVQRVMEETDHLGANVVFTANSSPASQGDALRMAVNRARVNFFGGLAKDLGAVSIDTNIIHYRELLVTGSHGAMPHQHAAAVDMIASGRIDISKFRTQEFALENILEAFQAAEDHNGLRVIVKP